MVTIHSAPRVTRNYRYSCYAWIQYPGGTIHASCADHENGAYASKLSTWSGQDTPEVKCDVGVEPDARDAKKVAGVVTIREATSALAMPSRYLVRKRLLLLCCVDGFDWLADR